MDKNILQEYQEAYEQFIIVKKWIKYNKDLLAEEYTSKDLSIPCDGYVQTKDDAIKAVRYYKAFYNKLVVEGETNEKIDMAFERTFKKYDPEKWE